MRCELISWAAVQKMCQGLAGLVRASAYRPDIVIAIGRGGYVPARLVCDYLDIMALTSIRVEHYLSGSERQEQTIIRYPLCTDIMNRHVLLVDDVNDSGDTLAVATQYLQTLQPCEIRTAVMQHKNGSGFAVDYCARKVIKWRWLIYPWAVNEDISGFLKQLSPVPQSLQAAQQFLAGQFGIKISSQRLRDVYVFMEPLPVASGLEGDRV
jgi:hypoxanthine phosphoribosyltransferase